MPSLVTIMAGVVTTGTLTMSGILVTGWKNLKMNLMTMMITIVVLLQDMVMAQVQDMVMVQVQDMVMVQVQVQDMAQVQDMVMVPALVTVLLQATVLLPDMALLQDMRLRHSQHLSSRLRCKDKLDRDLTLKSPLNEGFFYVQDVRYVAVPWMAKNDACTGCTDRNLLLGNSSCVALISYIHVTMQFLHFHHPWWAYIARSRQRRCDRLFHSS
jgi:hypothetical protein